MKLNNDWYCEGLCSESSCCTVLGCTELGDIVCYAEEKGINMRYIRHDCMYSHTLCEAMHCGVEKWRYMEIWCEVMYCPTEIWRDMSCA